MSSNIKVQRVCEHCGKEFTARTTVTRTCSDYCAKRLYKQKQRTKKIETSNKETLAIKTKPIEELKAKEFLTVREVATLLSCSIRSVYYYIENGNIEAVNLGQRITRIKRSALDKLFENPQGVAPEPTQYEIADCYSTEEVREKYGISDNGLSKLIKRHNIPKFREGWFAYVPKTIIEKHLGNP